MSQVKKLTRLGSDTRKIAALLQAKAPKGEMLAYINPKEAALLKAMGGSGKPHADTGIPSFQQDSEYVPWEYNPIETGGYEPDFREPWQPVPYISKLPGFYGGEMDEMPPAPAFSTASMQPQVQAPSAAVPAVAPAVAPVAVPSAAGFAPRTAPEMTGIGYTGQPVLPGPGTDATGSPGPLSPDLRFPMLPFRTDITPSGGLAEGLGLSRRDAIPLGLAGLQTVLAARQGRAVQRQGQAARREMQAMAAPYQQQGQQLQAQAARGELTPQAQQSLQAVRAQLTQGAQARGGVGAAQIAQQVEAVRQQLLQSQSDYGLKLSGIGDQIAQGAIRAGIQADQYANQLTSNYMGNIMYMVGQLYNR